MQATFGYRHITKVQVLHCPLPAGEKKRKASLLVSLLYYSTHLPSSSSLAGRACDKTQTSYVAVIITWIGSCTLPFLPPRLCLTLARIFTNTSFLALVSRWDRLLVFGACNVAALACFVLCFALFPILWPVPRKFAILFVYPVHLLESVGRRRVPAPPFTHTLLSKKKAHEATSRMEAADRTFVSIADPMFQRMTLHRLLITSSCN